MAGGTTPTACPGGLTAVAAGNRGVIIRKSADGQEKQLPIDFAKLKRGKPGDQALPGGDILFVPDSRRTRGVRTLAEVAHAKGISPAP